MSRPEIEFPASCFLPTLMPHRKTLILTFALSVTTLLAAPLAPIPLWPGKAPGETVELPPEADIPKPDGQGVAGRRVIRLGNVSQPTITVYPAPKDTATGAAVVVCPGGAYNILAYDLEGTEVCEWLNSIGVTGVLLKYRVPRRKGLGKHTAPLQDAQRALGIIRSRAAEWGLDPKRIGILGFSAGGHLAAAVSNNCETRTYPRIDASDDIGIRPDFTLLIYPGYLTTKEQSTRLAPELSVDVRTPTAFIVMAEDDPVGVENALFYALALKNAKVPFELHIYPTGGHGYGLRPTEHAVTTWPARAADWLGKLGVLKRRY